MNKTLLLFLMIMLFCGAMWADITQYYTFSASTSAYTPITGTDVPSAVGDDVISTPIDIGFTFLYGLLPYTQVKVSSNGYVTLGTTPGSTLGNSLISPDFCPVVAPLWDDTGYATVQYLLSGTAPNRIFTVQYTAMKWNYSSQTSFNLQVKLYEAGNVIFNYDTTASTPTNASASIGINMLPGGTSNFYSVTPGAPATASTTVENGAIVTWPGANTVYAFNPLIGGALSGTVTSSGSPLAGVTVAITNTPHTQETSATGTYSFPNVQEGTYSVTFTKVGYGSQTLPAVVVVDQTTVLNVAMVSLPVVSVTGTIYGSDAPTVGIPGAVVNLTGVINYSGTTNASGQFTITGVLSSTTYNYSIIKVGYQTATGTINVGATNYSFGNITMSEMALPPGSVIAAQNAAHTVVNLSWRLPGTAGGQWITWGDEDNSDSIGTGGVADFDVACRWPSTDLTPYVGMSLQAVKFFPGQPATFSIRVWTGGNATAPGTMVVDQIVDNPTIAAWNTVNLTSTVPIVAGQELWFGVRVNATSGYPAGCDVGPAHDGLGNMMYFQGAWSTLLALAPTLNFDWNLQGFVGYSAPTNFASLQPLTFNADRVNTGSLRTSGLTQGSAPTNTNVLRDSSRRPAPDRNDRALLGYRVWRLLMGQETNEAAWTSLTPAMITDTVFVDPGWGSVPNGQYKWAVKGVFTGNVMSNPAFSNMLLMLPYDLAATGITGNLTPTVGIASDYVVGIQNTGTTNQAAGAYTVKIMDGNTELSSVAGPAIAVGASLNVTVPWAPTSPGAMSITGKVVLTTDTVPANNVSNPLSIIVQPAGTQVITIGAGDQQAQIPVNMYWMNSLFETVYQATELNFVGMITGLSFYNNFATDLPAKPTKIWLGTTTEADLTAGWIPSTQLTQVFDGNVDYPSGINTITIAFPEPFLYLEGNLVMLVQRPLDTTYFSPSDVFYCQTVGTARSREVHQDGTAFDPENPPATAVPTGQFPKTGFYIIPGGVGHLQGTAYGANNTPLPNTTIQILNGAQATTNGVGHYLINNIIAGDYSVTASRYGYYNTTHNVTILEDSTHTLNFTMTQMPTVTVTGTIVGSDAPTVGLPGATISLTGYEDYQVTANAAGQFTIPGVYANQSYEYVASGAGYQNTTGTAVVVTTDLNMGFVVLSEIAYSPRNVQAAIATDNESINLSWLAPDPNAVDITQGFETAIFPPSDWTRVVTDNGPPNTSGVSPTWCRFGEVTVADVVVPPAEGAWQAGFWWSFSHQDEWLITPQFNCPQGASLSFETNAFYGSANGDHYYVKASADNGATWTELWDATAQTGGWNHYATPVTVDLGAFTGQQIKLAWHADDPAGSSDGMWYVWFIDNVVVANTDGLIRFPESQMVAASGSTLPFRTVMTPTLPMSRGLDTGSCISARTKSSKMNLAVRDADRSLTGYKVWRLPQGQEQNEAVWTSLTPAIINLTTLVDDDWGTLPAGTYKWAVKGVYTNNVYSLAMFSNPLVKGIAQSGTIAGLVRNVNSVPIAGATVTVGAITVTTAANGSYIMLVPAGTHSVTCTAPNYAAQTQNNIVVTAGQTTPLNFTMVSTGSEDDLAATVTTLKGNYPNPFNPVTTLSFDIKDRAPVRIDIYNAKGQLIRTLINETKANGHYNVVWNGKDNHGNEVASGIYNYRMQAGSYTATRRMMLMK